MKFGSSMFDYRSNNSFKRLKDNFIKRLLHIELRDAYCLLRFTHTQIFKLYHSVSRCIPSYACDSFFIRQTGPLYSFYLRERTRFDKKLKHLMVKCTNEKTVIRPIQYFSRVPLPQSIPTEFFHPSFSFKPFVSPSHNFCDYETNIIPNFDTRSSFSQVKNR